MISGSLKLNFRNWNSQQFALEVHCSLGDLHRAFFIRLTWLWNYGTVPPYSVVRVSLLSGDIN